MAEAVSKAALLTQLLRPSLHRHPRLPAIHSLRVVFIASFGISYRLVTWLLFLFSYSNYPATGLYAEAVALWDSKKHEMKLADPRLHGIEPTIV